MGRFMNLGRKAAFQPKRALARSVSGLSDPLLLDGFKNDMRTDARFAKELPQNVSEYNFQWSTSEEFWCKTVPMIAAFFRRVPSYEGCCDFVSRDATVGETVLMRAYHFKSHKFKNPFYALHFLSYLLVVVPLDVCHFITTLVYSRFFFLFKDWLVYLTNPVASCLFSSVLLNLISVSLFLPFVGLATTTVDVMRYAVSRPLLILGMALETMMWNVAYGEPIILRQVDDVVNYEKHITRRLMAWANTVEKMMDASAGSGLLSAQRIGILNVQTTLEQLATVPSMATLRLQFRALLPAIIEFAVVFLISQDQALPTYHSLLQISDRKELLARILAGVIAFLYYLKKAAESCSDCGVCLAGHLDNFYLVLDVIVNAMVPYIIIPFAVSIVLTSSGMDIVLNLLALEFVTSIDESLFESSETSYLPPIVVEVYMNPSDDIVEISIASGSDRTSASIGYVQIATSMTDAVKKSFVKEDGSVDRTKRLVDLAASNVFEIDDDEHADIPISEKIRRLLSTHDSTSERQVTLLDGNFVMIFNYIVLHED